MVRLFQCALILCVLANTAFAQFLLNVSGTQTGTSVSGSFSSANLVIGNDGNAMWGENTYTAIASYSFSNGSAQTLGGTTLTGLSGTIKLWGNSSNSLESVLLTINDSVFKGVTLKNLTFTASSSDIQFDALRSYIGDGFIQSQKSPDYALDATTLSISAIPEPSTYALILGSVALLVSKMRSKRKKQLDLPKLSV